MKVLRTISMWENEDMNIFFAPDPNYALNKLLEASSGAGQYFQVDMKRNDTESSCLPLL